MKIFISQSGERSRRVAELIHTWIESVIQAVQPWVSSSDIDRGSLWFTQIIEELSTTTHGIICLTRDNMERPWILFEAGALAKGLSNSRIYTLLIDLSPGDIRDPLAQFNHTRPTESDMFKLVSSINKSLESRGLRESTLRNAFDTYWPQFERDFKKIIDETEATAAPVVEREPEDILSETLSTVRGLDRRVRTVENSMPRSQNPLRPRPTIGPIDKPVAVERESSGRITFSRISAMENQEAELRFQMVRDGIRDGLSDDDIINAVAAAGAPYDKEGMLDYIKYMRSRN